MAPLRYTSLLLARVHAADVGDAHRGTLGS